MALKNAVANTALPDALDESKCQIFLTLVDVFTVWHPGILNFFDNPKKWFDKAGQTPPSLMRGSLFSIPKSAYPSLAGEDEMVDLFWNDLHNAGLHKLSGLKALIYGHDALVGRTTKLGKEFIQFISER